MMAKRRAMVLLSGGLDSVAALHWAMMRYKREAGAGPPVEAVMFDYGQANRNAELAIGGMICERRGIPRTGLVLAESVRGLQALKAAESGLQKTRAAPGDEAAAALVSKANLPARNLILLSVAAAHAARRWPGERIDLVIGACFDDQMGFPDCRPLFLEAVQPAIAASVHRIVEEIRVRAPWVRHPKFQILDWVKRRPEALEDVLDSMSCYAGTRCARCDACQARRRAFVRVGIRDGDFIPTLHGGEQKACKST